MFELTSVIPDSDFHFDFEECNICLKSKYFDVIPVQLHARNGFYCVNSEHESNEPLRDIRTEGKADE